jgi:poly(A)-specific ribonuclease
MFPNLLVRASKRHFIQIVENQNHALDVVKAARKEKFEKRVAEAVGVRKIIDLISETKSVVVGHNIFQDLVFIWSQFVAPLPPTVEGFCRVIPGLFPMYLPSKY